MHPGVTDHRALTTSILLPHASKRPLYLAACVAASIIALTVLLLPFGTRPGPVIPPFVAMYAVTMSMIEALTAYFLAIQFRSTGEVFLGGLAGAFGFVAVLVASQMLVFPGVFSAHGLFTAGPQSSIWMWALWHAGFPLFVLAALLARGPGRQRINADLSRKLGRAFIAGGPLLALFLAYISIARGSSLPRLITGGSYAALRHSPMIAVIIGATFLALVLCVRNTRLRNLLSLWLAIALLASLADAALTLSGSVRYDLGWYAGRILSIFSSSAVFCVLIFELSQLYDRMVIANAGLQQRAVRDGLTGAFNRGYFAEQFPREVQRSIREHSMLSLLIIDVDHFKTYNDLHGHQQGDVCLIAVVDALQNILKRPGDFIARYGGEEFVTVLPRTDAEGAHNIAHDIHATIASLNLPRSDTETGNVTVSIGISTLNPRLETHGPEELVRRADEALYQAKREGRNTTRIYSPENQPVPRTVPTLIFSQAEPLQPASQSASQG